VAVRLAFPALLLGSAILALAPMLVRLAPVGPLQSAFWRLAIAVLPLLLLARLMSNPGSNAGSGAGSGAGESGTSGAPATAALTRAMLGGMAVAGLFFAADLIVWHLGIVRTTIANASLFGNMASFMMMAYGIVVLSLKPTRRQAAAMALAVTGALCLFGASAELSLRHLTGDLMCLMAAVFYTGYLISIGKARAALSAPAVLAGSSLAGTLVILPVVMLSPEPLAPATLEGWVPLLVLGLGGQVIGQGLIVFALAHLSPSVSGIGLLSQPVLAALIGWLAFGEIMGPLEMVGAALILVALLSQSLPARPARQPAE